MARDWKGGHTFKKALGGGPGKVRVASSCTVAHRLDPERKGSEEAVVKAGAQTGGLDIWAWSPGGAVGLKEAGTGSLTDQLSLRFLGVCVWSCLSGGLICGFRAETEVVGHDVRPRASA